jgi:hypothetical protein
MLAVADGHALTLPARPDGVDDVTVCADSGMLAVAPCPTMHDYAVHGHAPPPDTWHDAQGHVTYPPRASGWLARKDRRQ